MIMALGEEAKKLKDGRVLSEGKSEK